MLELENKKDIDQISIDILRQSKALDVFPTPVDKIVHFSDLIFHDEIDIRKLDVNILSKFSAGFSDFWGKIRGFLDRRDKIIYIDPSQLASRKNFVKLHECGHQVLSWQKEILQHLDDDQTLSPHTKEEFEREANYFSSITLFQHDRFTNELEKHDLSLKAGMALGKKFGGSSHAALRRMVELSKKRCALLVLDKIVDLKMNDALCNKKDIFQSKSFTDEFGDLDLPNEFGYKWDFARDFIFKKRFHENGEITLKTKNGDINFKYHFFDNSYNAFVFLFPEGETQKSRIKVILSA
ncbi:ImmA/IrrE family metallo-endopeptidase [Flavobacterium mekongense]|uniref:ImmA/IrrE family metallo-endopeptidase n=1 Tax=Flavobacterium mekongense TaxID=3379707 RepID=UPI003999503D